ncbi:BLUF domain-containing protein [Thiorhodococcus mannitoliphagus]|uniref:BLUF domain-containing protein n=1 Tax=Thiorhodococcus mannitoliphagus TaxID=329406 RepID=A0A6P1DWE5_9GAMM|nr:BLUF domain-containing protein [Thiorhodococcus mannitoliphagus]NEX20442.1 BLUF domain-containing protein [Thiorhodococcus mannitoliphagus]
MKHLTRMMYVSRVSGGVGDDELKQILESSRRKNKTLNVTGVLCGGGGHFIQVLEGEQDDLFRLYGEILNDRRHYDSVLIGVASIKQRLFGGWSMGYLSNPPEMMEVRRKELIAAWEGRLEGSELLRLMKRFLEQLGQGSL